MQCNSCNKWRSLPHTVDASSLPEVWVCGMNKYDKLRSNCEAEEENYQEDSEDEEDEEEEEVGYGFLCRVNL